MIIKTYQLEKINSLLSNVKKTIDYLENKFSFGRN